MSEEPLQSTDTLAPPRPEGLSNHIEAALGRTALEVPAPPSKLSVLTDGFAAHVDAISQRIDLDSAAKQEETMSYFNRHSADLDEAFGGGYSVEDLATWLRAATDMRTKTFVDSARALELGRADYLQELYQSGNKDLIGMINSRISLSKLTEDNDYYSTALTVERVMQGKHGRLTDWMKDGKFIDGLPYAVTRIMEDERFGRLCAQSELNAIRAEAQGSLQNRLKLRESEKRLLSAMGVTPEMSRDFRLGLRARTVPTIKGRKGTTELAEFNDVGGVDGDEWVRILGDYYESWHRIGDSGVKLLYEKCGIVNLDRYDAWQLDEQAWLLKRLEAGTLTDKDLAQNMTAVFADALGDYNGSGNYMFRNLSRKASLIFEIKKPDDFQRYFALLKQMNIRPSKTIFYTHGFEGGLGYNQGKDSFNITSYRSSRADVYHIEGFGFGEFFRYGMQPDAVSGSREILLYACRQAIGRKGLEPMAKAMILQTEMADKAVVKAMEGSADIHHSERFGGDVFGKPSKKQRALGGYLKRAATYVNARPAVKRATGYISTRPAITRAAERLAGYRERRGIVQTVEFRRGPGPKEVVLSRPRKGTPLR